MSNNKTKLFSTAAGERPVKQNQIISSLKGQMLKGRLKPGSRLPTRIELAQLFDASSITVQIALDRLAREGFVEAEGRRGTFVAPHPPHLSNYGVVFSSDSPLPHHVPTLGRVFANEAVGLQSASKRFQLYRGLDGHADSEDYQHLVADIRAHRLAGLIFPASPHVLYHTPVMEEPGVPRVVVMSAPEDRCGIPTISLDIDSFIDKSLDYFASRGRRRVALVSGQTTDDELADRVVKAVASRRMLTRPYWLQAIHPFAADRARTVVHLLMNADQKQRPDAIIVADDTLAEPTTAGLLDAGVRVPQDVDVTVLCNFPQPPPVLLPVMRIGFDVRQLLALCVVRIDAQRQGLKPPKMSALAAISEDALPDRVDLSNFSE